MNTEEAAAVLRDHIEHWVYPEQNKIDAGVQDRLAALRTLTDAADTAFAEGVTAGRNARTDEIERLRAENRLAAAELLLAGEREAGYREALERMQSPPLVLAEDDATQVADWFVTIARTALQPEQREAPE